MVLIPELAGFGGKLYKMVDVVQSVYSENLNTNFEIFNLCPPYQRTIFIKLGALTRTF
jgi:hypothetical protein